MADASYGFYVSFRLPSGELFSSNRETVDEVRADIERVLGDEAGATFFERFAKREAAPVVVAPSPVPSNSGSAPAGPTTNPTVDDMPADGFETCRDCGSLKDDWKPGGISQAGKPYAGFFGCPNWRSHK